MLLDCGRVSLVNFRIPQVIPSHRLARHARTVQLQQQQQATSHISLSSSLHDEQRTIEESITQHRQAAIGDLHTGAPTLPSLPSPAPSIRSLTVSVPVVEAVMEEVEVDNHHSPSRPLPPSSLRHPLSAPPSISRSSSPSSVFSTTMDEQPSSETLRSSSPSSFSLSPSSSSHDLTSSLDSSSSSSEPVSSPSAFRPSARLQRLHRRMTIYTDDGDDESYISPPMPLRPSASSFPLYPLTSPADKFSFPFPPPAFPPPPPPSVLPLSRPPTPTLFHPQPLLPPPHLLFLNHYHHQPPPPPQSYIYPPPLLPTPGPRAVLPFPVYYSSPPPSFPLASPLISTLPSMGVYVMGRSYSMMSTA